MNIVALIYVSMSEIAVVQPDISLDWIEKNKEEFNKVLYSIGLETGFGYETQEDVQHRNRFNRVVQCTRWVGNERVDKEWIDSGYASEAAIDKSKNNRLLVDIYRSRGQVE